MQELQVDNWEAGVSRTVWTDAGEEGTLLTSPGKKVTSLAAIEIGVKPTLNPTLTLIQDHASKQASLLSSVAFKAVLHTAVVGTSTAVLTSQCLSVLCTVLAFK